MIAAADRALPEYCSQGPHKTKTKTKTNKKMVQSRKLLGQRALVWHNRRGWDFFFLLFTFWNLWNLFWVYQNGNFYWEKAFHARKKTLKGPRWGKKAAADRALFLKSATAQNIYLDLLIYWPPLILAFINPFWQCSHRYGFSLVWVHSFKVTQRSEALASRLVYCLFVLVFTVLFTNRFCQFVHTKLLRN